MNEVRVHFTKDDYNCIIAMLSKNFSEKGVIKKVNIQQTNSPNIQKPGANKGGGSNLNLSLPIKAVNLRKSRELLFSTSAPLNQDSNLDADEKHPKSKTTVFKFVFKEFSINLATANLVAENNFVPVTSTLVPLAKIGTLLFFIKKRIFLIIMVGPYVRYGKLLLICPKFL